MQDKTYNYWQIFMLSRFLLLYNLIVLYGVSGQTCHITCTITTSGVVTKWAFPPGYCATNSIVLSQSAGTDCGNKNDSCGPFIAANLAPPPNTPCTTSVLSVVGTPPVNGTNVSCYSNNILQSSYIITITAPAGLASCAVNVSMADGGLVVSCTPGTNGGLPSSYDITVDPGGIQIFINTSNGSIVQNISGLQPNTTYSVRVVAINCAGNSGEVVMNVTTALGNSASPQHPPLNNAVPVGVGVGIGVGVPFILAVTMVPILLIILCYKRSTTKYSIPAVELSSLLERSPPPPKPKLCLSSLPSDYTSSEIIVIECDYGIFEVLNFSYIHVREGPPTSEQWFYRKEEDDGSFVIISVSQGKALKCEDAAVYEDGSLQVVLCDIKDGDQWMMKDDYIIHKKTSKVMCINDHKLLCCGDKDNLKVIKSLKFNNKTCTCNIKHMKTGLLLSINANNVLVCSAKQHPQVRHQKWHCKPYLDSTSDASLIIVSAANDKVVTACITDVQVASSVTPDHLWRLKDGCIVSVKYDGRVIGPLTDINTDATETPLILHVGESKKEFVFQFEVIETERKPMELIRILGTEI